MMQATRSRDPRRSKVFEVILGFFLLSGVLLPLPGHSADDILQPGFDDSPLKKPVKIPAWFKVSFLDIRDDVKDAADEGKRGLIIYFGQEYCPYCKALLERDFGQTDIKTYTQRHFDIIAIDTRGSRLVTGLDGKVLPERDYAAKYEAQLTPTLVFFDPEGKQVLRLVGYHPPYDLRAALEFVADAHYRQESFPHYLARGEPSLHGEGELNHESFFSPPPYALDRSKVAAQQPLLVVFEQPECHACDVLHAGPFNSDQTRELLRKFDVVQLNRLAPSPVITPGGEHTTARKWAKALGLYYAPTLVFYDMRGKEIIRVSSVVHFHRLRGVLRYILEKGYLKYKNYQDWREHSPSGAAAS